MGKKGGPVGVISFHHRGIALKGKVVDFIWVFCSVLVIEHRGLLLTPSLTHSQPKWENSLIYCKKEKNERQEEKKTLLHLLINTIITFVSAAVFILWCA